MGAPKGWLLLVRPEPPKAVRKRRAQIQLSQTTVFCVVGMPQKSQLNAIVAGWR